MSLLLTDYQPSKMYVIDRPEVRQAVSLSKYIITIGSMFAICLSCRMVQLILSGFRYDQEQ